VKRTILCALLAGAAPFVIAQTSGVSKPGSGNRVQPVPASPQSGTSTSGQRQGGTSSGRPSGSGASSSSSGSGPAATRAGSTPNPNPGTYTRQGTAPVPTLPQGARPIGPSGTGGGGGGGNSPSGGAPMGGGGGGMGQRLR
jgi:hypothetical protein